MPHSSIDRCKREINRMRRRFRLAAILLAMAGVALATAAAGGALLQAPTRKVHPSSRGDKKAGATLFHESGCEFCHGPDARGTERGPDLGTVGKRLTTVRIEKQISEGGGGMPAFGNALQPDQIQNLVAFLHEKRSVPAAHGGTGSSRPR